MSKNIFVTIGSIIFIILVCVGGYYILNTKIGTKNSLENNPIGFEGTLKEISGNVVTVSGVYKYSKSSSTVEVSQDVSFKVSSSTIFKRVDISLPTQNDLKMTGKKSAVIKISDLPTKESPGSLQDLYSAIGSRSVYVQVTFMNSTGGVSKLEAKSIVYRSFNAHN